VCFSPEADTLVGAVAVSAGVDALRHVRSARQIPLASLPLLLGVHQFSEALVWWGLQGHLAHSVERVAIWVYVMFAFAVLPIFVPAAVGLVERQVARRRVIVGFGVLGAVVAVVLAVAALNGPIAAVIEGRHLGYEVDIPSRGGQLTALYVVATCGALLASSYRDLARIGALNLVAVPVLMWMTVNGFVSLWCFWAAIVSVLISLHFRRRAALRVVEDLGRTAPRGVV